MYDQFPRIRKFTAIVFFVCLAGIILALSAGCTVSVGAEGRAFYPKDDPRKGFFDGGGIDGLWSRPSGFNTLGE
jgi:hypothetical protein